MTGRVARVVLLALVLALAGCYRPAGEAIEPTPNTGQAPAPTVSTSGAAATTDEPATGEEPASAGTEDAGEDADSGPAAPPDSDLPPITVIVPTRQRPTEGPSGSSFTTSSTAVPGTTPTYITPGVPLGPIPEATATPSGGALTATPSGLVTPTAFAGADPCIHLLESGETLAIIARNFNLDLADLQAANPELRGRETLLQIGEEIKLPCNTPAPAPEQNVVEPPAAAPTVPEGSDTYVVRSGDTLVSIAARYDMTWQELAAANNMSNPNSLSIGQTLVIPPAQP